MVSFLTLGALFLLMIVCWPRFLALNPFLADSSPIPVDLSPRQTQTDPSVCNPCIAFGAGGQAQEPVQVSWSPLPFFSLRSARLFPQGVVLGFID